MKLIDRIALYNLFGFTFICGAFFAKISLEYLDVRVLMRHEGIHFFGAYFIASSIASYVSFRSGSSVTTQIFCLLFILMICGSWWIIGGVKLGWISILLAPAAIIYLVKTWVGVVQQMTKTSHMAALGSRVTHKK